MAGKSGVVWLAGSSAEISRARQVLSSLKQSDVIDELGFMVLQGAIAGRLYPGTSTIMTRARYLVFVPAIYRHLEETGKAKGKDADRSSRALQAQLRDVLVAANPGELGIIGRDAGGDVARPASNVYWRVLADLGIATQQIYEATYLSKLSKGQVGPHRVSDDDGAAHQGDSESLWDPSFPTAKILRDGVFPADLSFRLAQREAQELQRRYAALSPVAAPSLLSHTISDGVARASESEPADYPWLVPRVPRELAHVIEHARRLSLFARGVTLQYHQMLVEKKGERRRDIADAFEGWWAEARDDLEAWQLPHFLQLAAQLRGLRRNDATFLEEWLARAARAPSASALFTSEAARAIVASREATQRPTRGRLRSAFHLKSWQPLERYSPKDLYQLSYRHRVGQQVAHDIIAGLKGRAA